MPGFSSPRPLSTIGSIVFSVVALLMTAPAVPSSAGPAQMAADSGAIPIFVTHFETVGLSGDEAASTQGLTALTASLLADKFSCTTANTPSDVAALLGLARQQELLGTPEEQRIKVENVAGAMGGVLVGGTFSRVGNTYSVNIWATKPGAGQVTDREMASATGDSIATFIDLLEEVAGKLDMKVCRPKWTGTLTVTEKWDYFLQKPGYLPRLANATRNPRVVGITYTQHNDTVTATIPSHVGPGGSAGKVEAKLNHTIAESGFIYNLATQDVDCSGSWGAQMRGEYKWQPWLYETNTSWRVDARDSPEGAITVNVDSNGHYKISWQVPAMKHKRVQTSFGRNHPTPCEGPKNVESPTIEPELTAPSRTIILEGDVDPTKPDELSGEITENTPAWEDPMGAKNTSSVTKKWRLTATR